MNANLARRRLSGAMRSFLIAILIAVTLVGCSETKTASPKSAAVTTSTAATVMAAESTIAAATVVAAQSTIAAATARPQVVQTTPISALPAGDAATSTATPARLSVADAAPPTNGVSLRGRIVFLSSRDYTDFRPDMVASLRPHDLYVMNADGSGVIRLTNGLRLDSMNQPVMAPDGTQLVVGGYASRGGVRIIGADGKVRSQFVPPSIAAMALDWSSTGKILFAVFDGTSNEDIYSFDVGDGKFTRLTNEDAQNLFAAWSPDGTRIAYMKDYVFWMMNADGSEQRQFTEGEARNMAWSPDGKQIAYESLQLPRSEFRYDLWVIDADGANKRKLVGGPGFFIFRPTWSPDGSQIIFEANFDNPNEEMQIFVLDLKTGEYVQITQEGNNMTPFWAQ